MAGPARWVACLLCGRRRPRSSAYQSALGAVLATLFHFSGTRACVALAAAVLGIEVFALCDDLFKFGTELVNTDATHKLGPWQALKAYLERCWKL